MQRLRSDKSRQRVACLLKTVILALTEHAARQFDTSGTSVFYRTKRESRRTRRGSGIRLAKSTRNALLRAIESLAELRCITKMVSEDFKQSQWELKVCRNDSARSSRRGSSCTKAS